MLKCPIWPYRATSPVMNGRFYLGGRQTLKYTKTSEFSTKREEHSAPDVCICSDGRYRSDRLWCWGRDITKRRLLRSRKALVRSGRFVGPGSSAHHLRLSWRDRRIITCGRAYIGRSGGTLRHDVRRRLDGMWRIGMRVGL